MLEVHELQVAYGQASALWGVSLQLRERELLCVVGPNGAGKTTLINTLAGWLRARSGRIVLDGRELGGCRRTVSARPASPSCPRTAAVRLDERARKPESAASSPRRRIAPHRWNPMLALFRR